MNRKKKDYILLGVSVGCFFLLGISFVLMPIENNTAENHSSVITLVAGVLFWLSLVLGLTTQGILSLRRKKWISANAIKKISPEPKMGLISFFKNTYATIADIGLVCSIIGLVVAVIATQSTGFICYVFLGISVFLLSMHCILNGKNFVYVLNPEKIFYIKEYAKRIESKGKEEKDNG